jgi:hypothetical protein
MTSIVDVASTITAKLHLYYRGVPLGLATGFFKAVNEQIFLITNWHVVAGRDHHQTTTVLHEMGAIPDRLKLSVPIRGQPVKWTESIVLPLYQDADSSESPEKANWYEHPTYRDRVDVVAIRLQLPSNRQVRTIDEVNSMPSMPIDIGDEVFVLGYPKGIDGGGEFPIWKRASIATEPGLTRVGPNHVLIDTATREGMSGAPVIKMENRPIRVEGLRPRKFIGVYSCRLGRGELEAQLGKVWDASLIDEIIGGGALGRSSYRF